MSELGKTEKPLKDFFEAQALKDKEALSEKDVVQQIKALKTPGSINYRIMTDYMQKKLAPESLTRQGFQRSFPREWAAEFNASRRCSRYFTQPRVAEARRLALTLEACRDSRDVLNREADFRGKQFLAGLIISWLQMKITFYCYLYGDDAYPRKRFEYFVGSRKQEFELVVFSLTHGVYEGATIDPYGERIVWPQGKESPPDPETSIKDFPPLTSYMTLVNAGSVLAKPRE